VLLPKCIINLVAVYVVNVTTSCLVNKGCVASIYTSATLLLLPVKQLRVLLNELS
jgi:hypothetical protein